MSFCLLLVILARLYKKEDQIGYLIEYRCFKLRNFGPQDLFFHGEIAFWKKSRHIVHAPRTIRVKKVSHLETTTINGSGKVEFPAPTSMPVMFRESITSSSTKAY